MSLTASFGDPLPPLVDSLSRFAQQIDQTFTRVGEQLGEGLTLFETLNGALGGLSAELASSDLERTRAALRRLSGELRAFATGLPAETATLKAITGHNTEASRSLGVLREHLQLIAILAQSTRIEAASVPANREELRVFSDRIVALTGEAKKTVEGCVRDEDRLTGLLAKALTRQSDFVAQYSDSLLRMAQTLERSIETLDDRMAKSLEVTRNAAERSAKISAALGGAIVAMQSGDSIRQRLEHCVGALRLPIRAAARDGFAVEAGPNARSAPIDMVLRHLQSVQMREAGRVLLDEIGAIDEALAALAADTASMAELGRSLYGDKQASSGSFLAALEADLAEAADLTRRCDDARDAVDVATESLTNSLSEFQATVAGLAETIQDIVMIGTNSGLLAARLGIDGRGLVVIAGEVKSVADRIQRDASRLNPIFAAMQRGSSDLQDRDRSGARDMSALDQTIRESVDQMRTSGSRVDAMLGRLGRDSAAFGAVVGGGRERFAELAGSDHVIEDAAETLDEARSGAAPRLSRDDGAAVEDVLRQRLWPNYTMAAEREIHDRVLREFGVSKGGHSGAGRRVAVSSGTGGEFPATARE